MANFIKLLSPFRFFLSPPLLLQVAALAAEALAAGVAEGAVDVVHLEAVEVAVVVDAVEPGEA